mmetsp:Transcript_19604/g.36032  ORF Transcript_19604/g.36032 Transcript_19604/m.36032 type:complete len:218 (+) Transcript_19604:951-1604(+)
MGHCALRSQDGQPDLDISAPVHFHECSGEDCYCADWDNLIVHLHNRRFLLKKEGTIVLELRTSGGISVLLEHEANREFSIVFRKEEQVRLIKLRFIDIYDFLNVALKLKVACRPPKTSEPQCQTCRRDFSLFRCKRNCKNCGGSFCSNCLTHEALIPSLAYTSPQPICRSCTKVLFELRQTVRSNKSSFAASKSFVGLRPESPSKLNLSMSNMAPGE